MLLVMNMFEKQKFLQTRTGLVFIWLSRLVILCGQFLFVVFFCVFFFSKQRVEISVLVCLVGEISFSIVIISYYYFTPNVSVGPMCSVLVNGSMTECRM